MIKFDKPENLNGAELILELKSAGITINQSPEIDGEGNFWLHVSEEDKDAAELIVSAHNGTVTAPEQTIENKLASVGLSIQELREALLGGN